MSEKYEQVPAEKLRWRCDPAQLFFKSTDELESFPTILGQDRAVKALKMGMDMNFPGYNIYVSGSPGTGRNTTVRFLLDKIKDNQKPQKDICYVNNFKNPDIPIVMIFPAGQGSKFKKAMEKMIKELRSAIPKELESERFHQQRDAIIHKYEQQQKALIQNFEKQASAENFTMVQIQVGPYSKPDVLPLIEKQPVSLEQLPNLAQQGKLSKQQVQEIFDKHDELTRKMGLILKENIKLQREKEQKVAELAQNTIKPIITELVGELEANFKGKKVKDYLAAVQSSLLNHLELFSIKKEENDNDKKAFHRMPVDRFLAYRVNVIVDNSDKKSPPILFENNPSFAKLFGSIERIMDANGHGRTDFTKIRAGSVLRANGGYLVVHAMDVLVEPGVWNMLKRTLKNRKTEIQGHDPVFLISAVSLKPEPVDIDLKVIMIGDHQIYRILYQADPDFEKIFKIKADFDSVMKNNLENLHKYAEFIKKICDDEKLLPFSKDGVAAIMEYGVRLAGRQTKISTRFNQIADLVRESHYFATLSKAKSVKKEHVETAVHQGIERLNLYEEKIQEMIEEGTIMIETEGTKVGQVNGLSVIDLGEYMFGQPSKITAQVAMGREGIINIEREAELSGPTHNKGVLILSGYLQSKFAQDKPLAINAGICFEQSYSGVDGDSASSTEIYALLSRLSDVPIRQDIAVTGSVNQNGEIQPIGGVNEKIEGFYKVCKAKGLTGTQGVMIPRLNVPDLMLESEVVEQIEAGKFRVYPVDTIEQGIEILTGIPAGQKDNNGKYPSETIFGKADARLEQHAKEYFKFVKM
ncbi:AAA family ATPase [candidate division KSB1 bacterium]|nr:AAA family ATPase [candidate division KSB1 bacterium]